MFILNPDYFELNPTDNIIFPEVLLVIFLISMLVFKIREKIQIDNQNLIFKLHKNNITIHIPTITNIEFEDSFNNIKLETNSSSFSLKVSQFHNKKIQ